MSVRTYHFPDGTIQRVQTQPLPGWEPLSFRTLQSEGNPLDCFAEIFQKYLIPACPWLFGNLVLFRLPRRMEIPFSRATSYGQVADPLTAAAAGLRKGLSFRRGVPRYRNPRVKAFYEALSDRDCLRVVKGKLPITTILPVGPGLGLLTRSCPEAEVRCNASFFIMDPFDCATVFDHVGTCLGLMVKDGVVLSPPLYHREALLVRERGVEVTSLDIRDLPIQLGEQQYRHGENCRIYTRPRFPYVLGPGKKLVIVGNRVAAVSRGIVPIPASGYVLTPRGSCSATPGDPVRYPALQDVQFGIQVGNSVLRDGVVTDSFRSRFYNLRKLEPVPYPPSLYPMDFHNSRAARMVLGADGAGKPMLLWAEGAPKQGYVPGVHSRGASLSDLGRFCQEAGMVHAVNLDGGGSAALLVGNKCALQRTDLQERWLPNALVVEREGL